MKTSSLALALRGVQVDVLKSPLARVWFTFAVMPFAVLGSARVVEEDWLGRFILTQVTVLDAVYLSLLLCVGVVIWISRERQTGIWTLIIGTGLNPPGIVAAMYSLSLVLVLTCLVVQAPLLSLATTFGDVSAQQALAVAVAIFSFLAVVCGVAILCGTLFRSAVLGSVAAILLTALYAGGPFLLRAALQWLGGFVSVSAAAPLLGAPDDLLQSGSSMHRLISILSGGTRLAVLGPPFFIDLAVAAGIFALTCLLFERFHEYPDEPYARREEPRHRGNLPPRRAWFDAVAWKQFQIQGGGLRTARLKLAGYTLACVLISGLATGFTWRNLDIQDVALSCLLFFPLELMYAAPQLFGWEVMDKTLDTVLLLPLTTRQVVLAKIKGALLGAIPAGAFFLLGLILCLFADRSLGSRPLPEVRFCILAIAAGVASWLFACQLSALSSLQGHPWLAFVASPMIAMAPLSIGLYLKRGLETYAGVVWTPERVIGGGWLLVVLTLLQTVLFSRGFLRQLELRAAQMETTQLPSPWW